MACGGRPPTHICTQWLLLASTNFINALFQLFQRSRMIPECQYPSWGPLEVSFRWRIVCCPRTWLQWAGRVVGLPTPDEYFLIIFNAFWAPFLSFQSTTTDIQGKPEVSASVIGRFFCNYFQPPIKTACWSRSHLYIRVWCVACASKNRTNYFFSFFNIQNTCRVCVPEATSSRVFLEESFLVLVQNELPESVVSVCTRHIPSLSAGKPFKVFFGTFCKL